MITWDHDVSENVSYHSFQRQTQQVFVENNEIAAWGTWYLATSNQNGVRSTKFTDYSSCITVC